MNKLKDISTIKLGIGCFKYSFLIGTSLFLAFCFTKSDILLPIGLFYTVTAVFINSITLLILFISFITAKEKDFALARTAGLMLLNIPIAITYFWMLSEFTKINL